MDKHILYFSKTSFLESLKTSHPLKAPSPDDRYPRLGPEVGLRGDTVCHHLTILFIAITQLGLIMSHWNQVKTVILAKSIRYGFDKIETSFDSVLMM